jgi:hypothetical protein
MRGVSNEGLDIRLLVIVIPWLAVLALALGVIGTDLTWQRWFFGLLAVALGGVCAWFTVRTWRDLS